MPAADARHVDHQMAIRMPADDKFVAPKIDADESLSGLVSEHKWAIRDAPRPLRFK